MSGKIFYKEFFRYSLVDGRASLCSYHGFDTVLSIPETLDGYPVTRIGWGAFKDCQDLTSIAMPNSIITIDAEAFESYYNLREILIPDSVTTIETMAFFDCTGLREVTVTSIGVGVFESCTSLKVLIIPNSVIAIDKLGFECDIIIRGFKNSPAYEYAIDENIYFQVF